MTRQQTTVESIQISTGLITEASPLTFPDKASIDEDNFELSKVGSRRRRYGIEYEDNAEIYAGPIITDPKDYITFLWKNVAGYADMEVVVVAAGGALLFYSVAGDTISSGLVDEWYLGVGGTSSFDFASINGTLVATRGEGEVYTFTATIVDDAISSIDLTTSRLTIRDLFGVSVEYDLDGTTVDLTDQDYVTRRPDPSNITDTNLSYHKYNLRNQTYATSRLPKTGNTSVDPIFEFYDESDGLYPANCDAVTSALYANTSQSNATADRFHAIDLIENQQGSFSAPKGYFVIDALDRSDSRQEKWSALIKDQGFDVADKYYWVEEFDDFDDPFDPPQYIKEYYTETEDESIALPEDTTQGGATCLAEYGGRVWYGGFSEQGADTSSGRVMLTSYVLYSQSANDTTVLTKCYQEGDPTSNEDPELVDTDGGFLSLDGAYGIHKLITLGNSLVAFATNGVWAISGLDGNWFTPTAPRVVKITDRGSISKKAIVNVGGSILYWAKDGIFNITVTGAETYESNNITEQTIQTLYNEIPYTDKVNVWGEYDDYSSEVTWVVRGYLGRTDNTMLLKLLTTTGAFTKHTIYDGVTDRALIGPVEVPAFSLVAGTETVTANGEDVTADGETVVISTTEIDSVQLSVKYLTAIDNTSSHGLTFSVFSNGDYQDWGEVDAPGYMVFGYVSGGDFQRHKQIPYLTMHFERTEDGFEYDDSGDIVPSHQSGCYVQAQWDWANSSNSGKWGREFQAYRYRRHYMPEDVTDDYDYGFSTIITKNKLRGRGRVVSLKVSTEEAKDCRILGWSAIMGVNGNV